MKYCLAVVLVLGISNIPVIFGNHGETFQSRRTSRGHNQFPLADDLFDLSLKPGVNSFTYSKTSSGPQNFPLDGNLFDLPLKPGVNSFTFSKTSSGPHQFPLDEDFFDFSPKADDGLKSRKTSSGRQKTTLAANPIKSTRKAGDDNSNGSKCVLFSTASNIS